MRTCHPAVSQWNSAVMAIAVAALFVPHTLAAQSSAVERLLQLRQQARVAHVLGDARLLTGSFSSAYEETNDSTTTRPSREESERRFSRYFASVRFLEWEDMRPPFILQSAPDTQWVDIEVIKRVRTIPAGDQGTENAEHYMWVERWVRADQTWRLRWVNSISQPDRDSARVPLADRVRAWMVLERGRAALGGTRAVAEIAAVRFVADSRGPRRPFRTTVLSARDGRVVFAQDFPDSSHYRAGISLSGRWEVGPDGGRVDSLSLTTETVVRAHELLLLAFAPESRYTAPRAVADERLDGRTMNVVRFRDAAGAAVDFFYDSANGRPEGYRPVNHTGEGAGQIVVRYSDWRQVGAVLLPHLIIMTAGTDVFRYQVTDVSTDWIEDTRFRP